MTFIIKEATVVNEGSIKTCDVLIQNGRIQKIDSQISSTPYPNAQEIPAKGLHLFPGMIDDQVHFRDPGFTQKADIASESAAAAAGGVTSFMDMPNTLPNTLTLELLEQKYAMAKTKSIVNYSFFMGINQENLEEALKVDNETVCGITDDGLYFSDDKGILANYPDYLEKLFSRSNTLVALHSEDDGIIAENYAKAKAKYGNIPFAAHPEIRSDKACFEATKRVLEISKKYNNRLHIYHLSSGIEVPLFDHTLPLEQKRITVEACVHHLFFNHSDYEKLGQKIKWNPSVKYEADRLALIEGLKNDRIDLIASDHAPHTWADKEGTYETSMSGAPLVQHNLLVLFELYKRGEISLELIAQKVAHAPAIAYKIKERGFIREGYAADLVLVNLNLDEKQSPPLRYKCGWSPVEQYRFSSAIEKTWVNGELVFNGQEVIPKKAAARLSFERDR